MGKRSREADVGKWFEDFAKGVLDAARDRLLCRTVRLHDSFAAGNYLPEQVGDFIVALRQGAWLLECKASWKHRSLRSCLSSNMETHQASALHLWGLFQPAYVWFYSAQDEEVEVWGGESVFQARANSRPLDLADRVDRVPQAAFQDWLFAELNGGR